MNIMRLNIFAAILIVCALLFIIGCDNNTIDSTPFTGPVLTNPSIEPHFDAHMTNIEQISSFRYNLSDTALDHKYYYYQVSKAVKVVLNELRTLDDGTPYDEVFMDRVKETAYTHCSKKHCPSPDYDREMEPAHYEEYYQYTPKERMYEVKEADYLRTELFGNHEVDVFRFKNYNLETGTIYIQSHYGVPLKIEYDSGRTIVYENIMWNAVRYYDIMLPFNYTIRGQERSGEIVIPLV